MPESLPTPRAGAGAIHKLLHPATIRIGLPGRAKDEVLENLLSVLEGHPAITDMGRVREAVRAREEVMSTGVGKGLGLPHAKTPAATDTVVAFAVTREPVEFGAIDDRPVRLLFLVVGPETAKSEHIKILSRISRLMNRDVLRERLLQVEAPEEAIALFEEAEAKIAET